MSQTDIAANPSLRNSTVEASQKQQLIRQHVKLKAQLMELAEKMDEVTNKERQRKNKKNQSAAIKEDPRVTELKQQLKNQEQQMLRIKAETNRIRKSFDSKYDLEKIVERENEVKHLEKQLKELDEEKKSLERVKGTQEKAIRLGEDKEATDKIAKIQIEIRQIQSKTKVSVNALAEKEKVLRKMHENLLLKQAKAREMEKRLEENKKVPEPLNDATEGDVERLQEEIKNNDTARAAIEREGNERIKEMERQKLYFETELKKKIEILKEREKRVKLSQISYRDVKRTVTSDRPRDFKEASGKQDEKRRVVSKRGREAPDLDELVDQDEPPEAPKADVKTANPKQSQKQIPKDGKEQQDYGFAPEDLQEPA